MSVHAIRAFVGENGSGKTLAMIEMVVIPSWEKGRRVVGNLQLRPEALGFDPDLFRPLRSWREIPELYRETLILDEISSVLPARQSQSMPPQLIRIIEQLRKQDTLCAWTAPRWEACDVALRRCTKAVTICRGMIPDRWQREVPVTGAIWPRRKRDENGRPLRIEEGWLPNRLHKYETFEAGAFDDHVTNSRTEQLRPESKRRYWRTRHRAMHAYDTLQTVDMLDHLDDYGVCMGCGGNRRRPPCTCKREGPEGAPAPAGPALRVLGSKNGSS